MKRRKTEEQTSMEEFSSPKSIQTRNCGQIATVLFTHNVEILNEEKQWEKGNMVMAEDSKDSKMIRLKITTDEQTLLDELLTVQSCFTDVGNTGISWTANDVSQGTLRTVDITARFKSKKIREKFTTAWRNTQKQMNEHLQNLCECFMHSLNIKSLL